MKPENWEKIRKLMCERRDCVYVLDRLSKASDGSRIEIVIDGDYTFYASNLTMSAILTDEKTRCEARIAELDKELAEL